MLQAGFYFYGPGGFFFMLEVKLRNSTSIKLMNYCIDKYVQVILCLFAYSDVLHVLTNGRHELQALHRRLGSHPPPPPPVFGGVRVAYLFSFLFSVFLCLFLFLFFACFCLRPVSCVSNCITTPYDGHIWAYYCTKSNQISSINKCQT
jgi:hypothetical protein